MLFSRPKALDARVLSILAARAGDVAAFWPSCFGRSRKEQVISVLRLLGEKRRYICEKVTTREEGVESKAADDMMVEKENNGVIQIGKKQQTNASVIGPGMRGFLHP